MHKKAAEEDLRVQRTQKLIVEAMIELTAQKGFAKVTVRDIARAAGINRATFYRHYQDKFDLLDQYVKALYELTESRRGPAEPEAGMRRVFEHIRANAHFYRVMLGKSGDPAFAEKIRQYMQKRIRRMLPAELRMEKGLLDLHLSYMSGGALGVLSWWLEHDTPYSPEEMATIAQRLSAASLGSLQAVRQPRT